MYLVSEEERTTLGRNIAAARKRAKLSGEELASRAGSGLTRSIVANLENGRKIDVTVSQLLAIAFVLGVTPVSLLVDLYNPYGYMDVIRTDDDVVRMQNWLAFDWIGGSATPKEIIVDRDGVSTPAPDADDDTWLLHYLLDQRGKLLYAHDAQSSKVAEIEKDAREFGVWKALSSNADYQQAKNMARDFAAELYTIEGQLRRKGVMIDLPITQKGTPF